MGKEGNKPGHRKTLKMSPDSGSQERRRGQEGAVGELGKVQDKEDVNTGSAYRTRGPRVGAGQLRGPFYILGPRRSS